MGTGWVVVASLAGWAGGVRGLAGGGCGDGDRTADDKTDVDKGGGDADVFGDGPAGLAMLRAIICQYRLLTIVLESVLILCRFCSLKSATTCPTDHKSQLPLLNSSRVLTISVHRTRPKFACDHKKKV